MLKNVRVTDAAISSGGAFLSAQLEMLNTKINEPLWMTTWARDIPTGVGGGEVDFIRNLYVDYKTRTGTDVLVAGKTNKIPKVSVSFDNDVVKVNKWAENLGMGFEETMQAQQAGWYPNLQSALEKAITLGWNKQMDISNYTGVAGVSTGLLNSPLVTASNVALNAGATSRLWSAKTPEEIRRDIDNLLISVWSASQFVDEAIPTRVMVPPTQYGLLNQPMTTAGAQSVKSYIQNNNILYNRLNKNLEILPLRQLIGAGTGGTDRMIAYTPNEEFLKFQITVPLQKIGETQFILEDREFLSGYRGYYSDLFILYPTTLAYADGL